VIQIEPRKVWGAKHGRGSLDPGPESLVVIHHAHKPALTVHATVEQEREAVRSIERYHVGPPNNWEGIGYNFLVSPAGRIYEGRGWRYQGAHAGPVNPRSEGVCLLIDGQTTEPSMASILAVRALIREGLITGEIARDYTISGHRDHMPRTCPGDRVYARLQEFRHDAIAIVPSLAIPLTPPQLDLRRIERPAPAHVEEIARVRRLTPDEIHPGLAVAEVLLRGVAEAAEEEVRAAVKRAADALSEWILAR
jgi:hypothetical protein